MSSHRRGSIKLTLTDTALATIIMPRSNTASIFQEINTRMELLFMFYIKIDAERMTMSSDGVIFYIYYTKLLLIHPNHGGMHQHQLVLRIAITVSF